MDRFVKVWIAETKVTKSHINVGTGKDYTIRELAETITAVTEFKGKLVFDQTKLTVLGWAPENWIPKRFTNVL